MISLSAIDRERFGIVSARCSVANPAALAEAARFCDEHQVELAMFRCDASDVALARAIEDWGGRLMDTLVYYSRRVATREPGAETGPGDVRIRRHRAGDAEAVRAIAAEAFTGYLGHYHADPRLDRARADEAYADWAHRSCLSREVADEVLVAERGPAMLGFVTLRRNDAEEAEIVLNGVVPAAQRGGVYRHLLLAAIGWAADQSATRVVVSTQLCNVAPQKAWVRVGFEPLRAVHTFHAWPRLSACPP